MSRADSPVGGPVGRDQVDLSLLGPADVPALVELERRNREQLLVGAPRREADWFTEAGQRTALAHALAAKDAGLGLPLGIRLLTEGEWRLVGRLTLTGITRGAFQSASLGYWVDHALTGRGIATHAVRLAIAVAFGGLGLHRLQAEVQVGNDASARVLARCGFTEYGLAPDYLRLGDGWADCRLFQLVHHAWAPADGSAADGPAAGGSPSGASTTDDSAADGTSAGRPTSDGEVVIRAEVPALAEALDLYDAVGWGAYTAEPDVLERSLLGSRHVVTARRDGRLLGLARVVGDGATLTSLQDVLVRPEAERQGIGRRLVEAAFAPFADVRQKVLLTDAEPGQRAFYEALGFTEAHDHEPVLRSFVRLR